MIKLSTKVLFLGRENGGAVSFYEMSGSSINKISPYVVDSLMVNHITLNGPVYFERRCWYWRVV